MSAILCHTNISEVVSKYPPKPVRNLTLTPGKFMVSLTWKDPQDYTEEGYTCTWVKTVVVRKQGGYPKDIHDGNVVVTTVERDKYTTSGYKDTGLTGGKTYYYRVFACSTDGVYSEPAEGSAVPIQYRIMTVKINLNNSNPATCGSYADNAVNMPYGKTEQAVSDWQDFFGYKPCLFKKGKVVGYLNPNDYTKFENGTAANITSVHVGDVMIEFPRRGVRISKSGKVITVSMTDDPNDSNFKYYAHQRGNTNKDYFYLGAYLSTGYSYESGDYGFYPRSVSGSTPWSSITASTWYECSKMYGSGKTSYSSESITSNYGLFGFYQLIFIQVMYLLQFRGNLNSQSAVGNGFCGGDTSKTGTGNNKGMIWGTTSKNYTNKLFGLEDLWGMCYQYVYNAYFNESHYLVTTTDDNFYYKSKDDETYYTDHGNVLGTTSDSIDGFMTDCVGTSECGFLPIYKANTGSSSTYFCDDPYIDPVNSNEKIMIFGGDYDSTGNDNSGIFNVRFVSQSSSYAYISTRLQYL